MTQAQTKVSLGDIKPFNWKTPQAPGWFYLTMHDATTLEVVDGLPTGDKNDEVSVNECATRRRFGNDKYIVVVSNPPGRGQGHLPGRREDRLKQSYEPCTGKQHASLCGAFLYLNL